MLPASALILCLAMAAEANTPTQLPVDRPIEVSGVGAACTGIGYTEEQEARWRTYPIKLEAVNSRGQYLGNEDVTLRGCNKSEAINVACKAPWVLLKLTPGQYSGTMEVPGSTARRIAFTIPKEGQKDVIVRFRTGEFAHSS
jgi:hypothetical protein